MMKSLQTALRVTFALIMVVLVMVFVSRLIVFLFPQFSQDNIKNTISQTFNSDSGNEPTDGSTEGFTTDSGSTGKSPKKSRSFLPTPGSWKLLLFTPSTTSKYQPTIMPSDNDLPTYYWGPNR